MKKILAVLIVFVGTAYGQDVTRTINQDCSKVWKTSIQTISQQNFRPTVLDKDSGIATFAYDGGTMTIPFMYKNQLALVDQYVQHPKYFNWGVLRIDALTIYTTGDSGTCSVKLKIAYSIFTKKAGIGVSKNDRWEVVQSNGNLETSLLNKIDPPLVVSPTQ